MAVKSQVMGPLGGQLDLHLHGYALEAIKFFAKELKIDRFKTNLTLRLHHKFVMTSDKLRVRSNPLETDLLILMCVSMVTG